MTSNTKNLHLDLFNEIAEIRAEVYNEGFEAGIKEGVLLTIAAFKTGDVSVLSETFDQPHEVKVKAKPAPINISASRPVLRQRRSKHEIDHQFLVLVQEAGRAVSIHDFLSRYPTTSKATAHKSINRLIQEQKIIQNADYTFELINNPHEITLDESRLINDQNEIG